MNRKATIVEIARVFIDALGKQIDPDDNELIYLINEACKAHRLGHIDRYNNCTQDVKSMLSLDRD